MHKFKQTLEELAEIGRLRQFKPLEHQGKWIIADGRKMLNCSSNDYLGLAGDVALQAEFWEKMQKKMQISPLVMTSSSSRLLTGNFPIYSKLETCLANRFGREAALIFNSGYHANIGILPALCDKKTLILADKLVHASLIDGIRLADCTYFRYRHNDLNHLQQLLEKYAADYERVIIVTESLFSMDGDFAPLAEIVALKKAFSRGATTVMIYLDEAHAIGAYGEQGLGVAELCHCIHEIDFLVGTFGKALASMGAYLVCDRLIRDYLINTMRPLIFSTALPPISVEWTTFLFEKLPEFQAKRHYLMELSQQLQHAIMQKTGHEMTGRSAIVPLILGEDRQAVEKAQQLQRQGFYCLPIRPPTVPKGTARIRFSLTADMTEEELGALIHCL